jgi:hypothetical protein
MVREDMVREEPADMVREDMVREEPADMVREDMVREEPADIGRGLRLTVGIEGMDKATSLVGWIRRQAPATPEWNKVPDSAPYSGVVIPTQSGYFVGFGRGTI